MACLFVCMNKFYVIVLKVMEQLFIQNDLLFFSESPNVIRITGRTEIRSHFPRWSTGPKI